MSATKITTPTATCTKGHLHVSWYAAEECNRAGATYRCTDCGHTSATVGESHDHTGTAHKPFLATCSDGYTRMYATEDEAREASRDGIVKPYRTTAQVVAEARARRAAKAGA